MLTLLVLLDLFVAPEVEIHELLQMDEGVIHSGELLQYLDDYATVEVGEDSSEELLLLIEVTWLLLTAGCGARHLCRRDLASTVTFLAVLFVF